MLQMWKSGWRSWNQPLDPDDNELLDIWYWTSQGYTRRVLGIAVHCWTKNSWEAGSRSKDFEILRVLRFAGLSPAREIAHPRLGGTKACLSSKGFPLGVGEKKIYLAMDLCNERDRIRIISRWEPATNGL